MPKGFKNMKNKAKEKATNYAAKKIYGADVIEAVACDWCAPPRFHPAPTACAPSSLLSTFLTALTARARSLSAGFMDSLKTWMDAHQSEFSAGVGTEEEGMYPPQ